MFSTKGGRSPRGRLTTFVRTSTSPPRTSARAPCSRRQSRVVVEPSGAPMLAVRGLEVRYGRVPAVRGVDLALERGEIVGLIGPNGAGKSTTLHAIMGAVPLHGGDVRLAGRSLRGRAPEAVARAG